MSLYDTTEGRLLTSPPAGAGRSESVPRSVGRALDLLEIVLAKRACNLTTAAASAGLTPTTARRHLKALEARGYLERDATGLFSAGPTLLRLAAVLCKEKPLDSLIATAQPHLDRLARETGESAYLALSDHRIATYVATAESSRAIRHVGWVGQDLPLDGTAMGAALAEPGSPATRTGAVEPDITAISVALPERDGPGIALSVIGPEYRLQGRARDAARTALAEAARDLQARLGLEEEVRAT